MGWSEKFEILWVNEEQKNMLPIWLNLEDDEYLFILKNGKLEMVFKKEILNEKFRTLSRLYENGKKSRIVCLSRENTAYYGTVKYFRENGTPLYSGQFYAGKMEGM